MKHPRSLLVGAGLTSLIAVLGVGQAALEAAGRQEGVMAPAFEVDPLWPKPLPNHWILGSTIGVGVDSKDHVFIVHRGFSTLTARTEAGLDTKPPTGECCAAAPPVLEFDPEGNLVKSWGGPGEGYDWPASNHGIAVDHKDNIWIGGNSTSDSTGRDSHLLKFTHDGRFLLQVGKPKQAVDSKSLEHFGGVAKISFDAAANEAYVADGYGNKRVAVIDMDNGKIKRFWGAYGKEPSDSNFGRYNPDAPLIPQFRNPVHCAEPTPDGLVYVCDRPNDRIQVFKKDGSFVKEVRIAPKTLGDGSVWDIAFSRDPQQKYLYLADGKNEHIYVMDRQSLEILTMFGDGGRQPGQWFAVHSIATDSKGNIYTVETYEGKRLQKFVYRGLKRVSAKNQGVPWPKR
ncbi:MAG TPA: hypothetical protein VGQ69_12635 [Gemmatimonadales bacterium]|jgi:DNA-binding beta-propeller fold protein YncE|nr:hypothetical protein [Gemmatimonadales bacterium]